MKYVQQALVIALVTLAGELLRFFVPLPIPASIYGLLLLFLLLKTGLVKLRQVQDVGQLLLDLMPVLLVPACVSLVTALTPCGRCSCRCCLWARRAPWR